MAINLKGITPNKVSDDFGAYSTFIYGTAKIGKSTFINELYGDRVLQIFTEKRFQHLEGAYIQYVSTWQEFMTVMKQLKDPELKEKFDVVSIDTVENLFNMLEKHIAAKFDEEMIGSGSVGYGKDWTALKDTWKDGLALIEKNGYVPVFVSHSKQVTTQIPKSAIMGNEADGIKGEIVEDKNGIEYLEFQKFVPDGPDRMMAPINKMADNILFMSVTADANGNEQRVISLRETLQWSAGSTFANIAPVIPLSADAYKKAVKDALGSIDESKKTKDYVSKADIQGEELDFTSLMNEMKELGGKFMEAGRQEELQQATEQAFGPGVRATEAKPSQVEIVKTLVDELKEIL